MAEEDMYIKSSSGGPSILTIREIDGDRLESPIRVEFSKEGVARVKEGVGELLVDLYDTVSVHRHETEDQTEPQDSEE